MNRILVSVAGSGLGHATRVYAILNKLSGADILVMSNGIGYEFFKKTKFRTVEIESLEIGGKEFEFSLSSYLAENLSLTLALGRNYKIFKKVIEDFKPDLIISDSEPSGVIASRFVRIPLVSITNLFITTSEYSRLPKKLINKELNSQIYLMNNTTRAMLNISSLVLNIDIDSKSNSKYLKHTGLVLRDKPQDSQIDSDFYLVSFGGANYGQSLLRKMIPILRGYKDKKFVISTNYAVNKVKKDGNVILHPFIEDYLDSLKASRGVISLAGLSTISETLSFRKPSLTIPIPNHIEQICNAHTLDRKGYSIVSYLDKNVAINSLKKSLEKFFAEEDKIASKLKKAKINDNGAEECANFIREALRVYY